MATVSSSVGYMPYLNFALHLLSLLAQAWSLFLLGRLFLLHLQKSSRLTVKQLSASLLLYILTHLICSSTSFLFVLYTVVMWRPPPESIFQTYPFYFLSILNLAYYGIGPVPAFFLALERCLILWMPTGFTMKRTFKRAFIWTSALTIAGFLGWLLGQQLLNLPLDEEYFNKTAVCVSKVQLSSCMTTGKFLLTLYIRIAFGSANIVLSILLLYLLRSAGGNIAASIKNRTVRFTIFLEIFFDLIPAYLGFAYYTYVGSSVTNVIGDYSTLFCVLEKLILLDLCALLYDDDDASSPAFQPKKIPIWAVQF